MQVLNYTIIRSLGEGGMGEVYLAKHNQLERYVAIKQLSPHLLKNKHLIERFKAEALTLAGLSHPTIVTLYDYAETPEGLFLIMEYVEGETLDNIISPQNGRLPEEIVIHYFSKILEGFNYAHSKGVIHRDIKPANIMVSNTNEVKILDFGIAKLVDNDGKNLTKTGMKLGTLLYMSPEQIRGAAIDYRSDIYSLGVTLYQMLTGNEPYDYQHLSEYDITLKIVNEPLIDTQSEDSEISKELCMILETALAKDPESRYPSCNDFKNALETYLQHKTQPKSHTQEPKTAKPEFDIELELPQTANSPKIPTKSQQNITEPYSNKPNTPLKSTSPFSVILGIIGITIVAIVAYFAFWPQPSSSDTEISQDSLANSSINAMDSNAQSSADTLQPKNTSKPTQPVPKTTYPTTNNKPKEKPKENGQHETTNKQESQTTLTTSENQDITILKTLTWNVNNRKNLIGDFISELSLENTGTQKIKTATFRFKHYNKQGKQVHRSEEKITIELAPKSKKIIKQKVATGPDVKTLEVELIGGSIE
ncbi:MAG: serine/threonine protein kinase [Bacteroidia bacterium]|nr:serine/threonine protein kinase [Bacteroidia bacterium]